MTGTVQNGSAPPIGGADPAVLEEKILARRARQLGDDIAAHKAVISALSAERDQVIVELNRFWKQRKIARYLGCSEQRISIIITRWWEKQVTAGIQHMHDSSELTPDGKAWTVKTLLKHLRQIHGMLPETRNLRLLAQRHRDDHPSSEAEV